MGGKAKTLHVEFMLRIMYHTYKAHCEYYSCSMGLVFRVRDPTTKLLEFRLSYVFVFRVRKPTNKVFGFRQSCGMARLAKRTIL